MKCVLATAIVLIVIVPAVAAERWRNVGTAGAGQPTETAVHVDMGSIRRSGDRVTFSEMRLMRTVLVQNGIRIKRVEGDLEVNCRTSERIILRNIFFDDAGTVVRTSIANRGPRVMPPGSAFDIAARAACDVLLPLS